MFSLCFASCWGVNVTLCHLITVGVGCPPTHTITMPLPSPGLVVLTFPQIFSPWASIITAVMVHWDCNVTNRGSFSSPQKGRKCSRTHKAPEPLRLSYAGCRSTRLYRPNYCGLCVDGRCCSPRRTRTASVTFACPDGERFDHSVMFVQSCKCSDKCSHLNEVALPPQQWLYGDTHKFTD